MQLVSLNRYVHIRISKLIDIIEDPMSNLFNTEQSRYTVVVKCYT